MSGPHDTSVLTEARLEELLRTRYAREAGRPCAELETLALVLAGAADEATQAAAADHLQACPECATDLLQLEALRARGALDPTAAPVEEAAPAAAAGGAPTSAAETAPPRAWLRRVAPAALAAAAAAALVLAVDELRTPEGAAAPPDREVATGLVPKGLPGEPTDALAVAVQRGTRRFTARPGDLLQDGDQLGLFYSATTTVHLAVLHRDEAGAVTPLFPAAGVTSQRVAAGRERPLPDGAVLEAGAGCEWLVAIFSPGPQAVAELSRYVRRATVAADCRLEVEVPGARHVAVFPVAR